MARKPLNFDPPGETSAADAADGDWTPEGLGKLPLLEFIPALSPEFSSPTHQADWCDVLERVEFEPIVCCNDTAIQHYKTETTLHGLVRLLCRHPRLHIVYMTYDHDRAQLMGTRAMELAIRAGLRPPKGSARKTSWATDQGGGMETMSAQQSREGCPIDLLVVDDPMQEHDAIKKECRDAVEKAVNHYRMRMAISSRLPGKGSTLAIMSRWNLDDLIARMQAQEGDAVLSIHHPAIIDIDTDHEQAWAPNVISLERLQAERRRQKEVDPSEKMFFARVMGDPRPDLFSGFGDPTYYYDVPLQWGFREAIGMDLSYSVRAGSDFCGLVRVYFNGDRAYVRKASRCRKDSTPSIVSALHEIMGDQQQMPIYMYASGPEVGLLRYLHEQGFNIVTMLARYNKTVRATKTMARWNAGEIMVPHNEAWVPGFVQRLKTFTGMDGGVDDEADALVSACDGNWGISVGQGGFRAFGTRAVPTR